jgi:CarD family transcriptional regulator
MYSLNEKVVYPGHGVASINRIIEKSVSGSVTKFFELKFLHKEMTILLPINNIIAVGVRRLSSEENIEDIFLLLEEPIDVAKNKEFFKISSWNKRSKQYQFKLRSGNIVEITKIYRDLQYASRQKGLSFGEKNLLTQTEALLAQEISLVKNVVEERAVEQLRSFFKAATKTSSKVFEVQG